MIKLETKCGYVQGNTKDNVNEFLGVPYGIAKRFEYAVPVTKFDGNLDATKSGDACPQFRAYNPHLENPARLFYYKEFREGQNFTYSENCLNCNIYTPEKKGKYPVIVFIHGGGFDSGSNSESPFNGEAFAKLGIVTVFINYRVGILGYLTNEKIFNQFGRDGNFGLDDQLVAVKWVKENIDDYYGDSENITLMGQSAGAISIQYLCCNHKNEGLFKKVIMMSGGGKFPDFALPRKPDVTREYWKSFMEFSGFKSFEELKSADLKKIFDAMEDFKLTRKDNTYNTMPVFDGVLIDKPIKESIKNPLEINYMLGYTNCDMYAPLMALINHKFVKKNGGYIYYFDVNPKGDDNSKAFHSSDLRYMFNTLGSSWRPYDNQDKKIADLMEAYVCNFVKYGNPNGSSGDVNGNILPLWKKTGKKALRLCINKAHENKKQYKMVRPKYFKLLWNMLTQNKLV